MNTYAPNIASPPNMNVSNDPLNLRILHNPMSINGCVSARCLITNAAPIISPIPTETAGTLPNPSCAVFFRP